MAQKTLYGLVNRLEQATGAIWRVFVTDYEGHFAEEFDLAELDDGPTKGAYRGTLAAMEVAESQRATSFLLLVDNHTAVRELNREVPRSDPGRDLEFMLIRGLAHQFSKFKLYHPGDKLWGRQPDELSRRLRSLKEAGAPVAAG